MPTDPARGFPDAMSRIRRMLREAMDACGAFEGIGIACPGPLDPFTGIIGDVGTLPGWESGNLNEALAAEFGVSVAVENDADAASLAEFHWGASRSSGNCIYITVSTGIGGGIVLGGKLYRGVEGAHPEIGHQIIDNSGPARYCGARGCWESLASGTAMSAGACEMAPESNPMTAADICDRARQGDELALRAAKREGY
jgi:glucokinase